MQANRDRLARALNSHGFATLELKGAGELLSMIPKDVMLVLIAQRLADMSAFDAIRQLTRENPFFAGIPMLICSSDNSGAFARKCFAAGFKGIVYLPFSRVSLAGMVRDVLVEEGMAGRELFGGDAQMEEIQAGERFAFLSMLFREGIREIVPVHAPAVSVGYTYPLLTDFFALKPGDEYDILRSFRERGIIRGELYNKVTTCGNCASHTINFRRVCVSCGGIDIDKSRRGLEFSQDSLTCRTCGTVFRESRYSFNCFNCGFSGDMDSACVVSVFSYGLTDKAREAVATGTPALLV